MLPSVPKSSRTRAQAVGPTEDAILRAVLRFHYLSSQQVCRLLYSPGSLTYVQSKLKRLTDAGFCQRVFLPRTTQRGSAPSVYTLNRKGLNYLKSLGLETAERFRASEQREHSYLFLAHTLSLNDFLISAELISRGKSRIALQRFIHERELKRAPVHLDTSDDQRITVIPDAWLDLRIDGAYQVCLVVELDRGTEEQKAWRRKVRGLLAYSRGPYQEAFHTKSLTFAVLTTAGDKRLLDLIRWTEHELAAMKEERQGSDLFILTTLSPDTAAARDIFFAPRWYQPFGARPIALLDL